MKTCKDVKPACKSLSEYVDFLQTRGEYVFKQKSAQEILGCSEAAIRLAANRLIKKQRIIKLRQTFYLIIPLEYQTMGAPPASWYIDALMRQHHRQPYYVALLSAAALHGAAHQQPQLFQVITNKPLRPITIGRTKIIFIVKKSLQDDVMATKMTIQMKTPTGYMNVATSETTAFDLVHYVEHAGYLNNIATVLTELLDKINPEKLLFAAKNEKVAIVQRAGYLLTKLMATNKSATLEHPNINWDITKPLLQWLHTQKIHPVLLRCDKDFEQIGSKKIYKDQHWQVYENETIEADL
jgi:predicted transcriptional regulator of viral defense system